MADARNLKKADQDKVLLSNQNLEAYRKLVETINETPETLFKEKLIQATDAIMSIADVIAYQIGWGTLLVSWYKVGIEHKTVVMPVQVLLHGTTQD